MHAAEREQKKPAAPEQAPTAAGPAIQFGKAAQRRRRCAARNLQQGASRGDAVSCTVGHKPCCALPVLHAGMAPAPQLVDCTCHDSWRSHPSAP